MTQIEAARNGIVTPEIKTVAGQEAADEEKLRDLVAEGLVVIPANKNHHNLNPIGIGKFLKTKVNANIGTSGDFEQIGNELDKMEIVLTYKADTVMDLSTGGDIKKIRRALLNKATIPFGNVPIYEICINTVKKGKIFVELEIDEMLDYITEQAEDGVDFMTIHAGLTLKAVDRVKMQKRKAGIVSRGGSLLIGWMLHNNDENPFYKHFDRILEIAKNYDVTLSLGDGLRPGSLADGSDWGQIEELLTLGELVKRSREAGVQVMVEGPGHLPIDQIDMNIKLQKSLCLNAPFYVLGPIVTDIAPGYDHITSAIGGSIAGAAGADFLCYVTPNEHLGLPDSDDVKNGIIASRIASHVADIAKGVPNILEHDNRMAEARKELDWQKQEKYSIDPIKFRKIRTSRHSSTDACSMCGEFCVYKILKNLL
ncbi:MAG: phosphomethylpyrimidine synthase ThiC [Candidatus Aminicenantes bacterium]|nr:phosphomethylpyrimidine synthase ThiC [Candidatus Aminicenantes bacterium]